MKNVWALPVFLFPLICLGDELHLRDGTILKGKLRAADENVITFEAEDGTLLRKSRAEVRAIILDGPQPPTVADGLKAVRWTTFRRVTQFKDMGNLYACQISANGEKIMFCGPSGTFLINSDGSNLVQLSKRGNDGYIGISADAKRVVWYYDKIYAANADGSGAAEIADFYIRGMRLTAAGDRLLVLNLDGDLVWLNTDGSKKQKIAAQADIAKAGGREESGWNNSDVGMGLSADGSRLVFRFGQNAFAMNGDGTGLRRLTDFDPGDDNLNRVRISADGSTIAYLRVPDIEHAQLTILNWDGSRRAVFEGKTVWPWGANGRQLALSPDGRWAALSPGIRLFSTDGKTSFNVDDWGNDGDSDDNPIFGLDRLTFTSDFTRGVGVINGQQIVMFEFNPLTHGPAPLLGKLDVAPRVAPADYQPTVIASAEVKGEAKQIRVVPLRDGWRVDSLGLHGKPLAPDGGAYRTERMRVDEKTAPGPMTLRYSAFNAQGHGLIVDVEGFQIGR
jgi:hypothetical protein